MPPPTPRRKLPPPPPDNGEDGEKDPLPEGLVGLPKDFEGLLPDPLLEPPMDLPPLLDLASARSERPRTTSTAKTETRSVICLMDDVLFNIRCLQYNKLMVFNEEMESARRRMAPQDCKIQGKSNQEMF
jgi:hypothetical protein